MYLEARAAAQIVQGQHKAKREQLGQAHEISERHLFGLVYRQSSLQQPCLYTVMLRMNSCRSGR